MPIKLIPYQNLDDGNRIDCLIVGAVAMDPETGIYLEPSAGRKRPGNRKRYFIHNKDKAYPSVMAFDDKEAIEKANKLLARVEEKG